MTHTEACATVIPLGRYKGKSIEEATNCRLDHDALRWLDWFVAKDWAQERYPEFHRAVAEYLSEPAVRRSLELALESKGRKADLPGQGRFF